MSILKNLFDFLFLTPGFFCAEALKCRDTYLEFPFPENSIKIAQGAFRNATWFKFFVAQVKIYKNVCNYNCLFLVQLT
jgi:hypothetical protein